MLRITPEDLKLGLKVKEARVAKGLSRQQLAKFLDVSYQQLAKYETGSNRISASKIPVIAKVLNKQILYFFDDEAAEIGVHTTQSIQLIRGFAKLNPYMQQTINQLIRQAGA
jgi:transcriptional regulator with XRE-family HTH domain